MVWNVPNGKAVGEPAFAESLELRAPFVVFAPAAVRETVHIYGDVRFLVRARA